MLELSSSKENNTFITMVLRSSTPSRHPQKMRNSWSAKDERYGGCRVTYRMSVTSRSLHVEGGRVSTEHRKIGCAG